MSVTLAELKERTRYFIRDTAGNTVPDAELVNYINEAQNEVAAMLAKIEGDFLLREATMPFTAGVTEYPYPNDIFGRNIRSLYVYGTDPTRYRKIDRGSLEEVYNEGAVDVTIPRKYTCLDGFFKVGPPPNDSSYFMQITYIRQPTALALNADTMDADDEFKELICVTAAIRALEPRGGKESVEMLAARQQALLSEASRLITKEDILQGFLAWKY